MSVNAQQIKRIINDIEANGVDLSTVKFEIKIYTPGHSQILSAKAEAEYGGYKVRDEGVVIYLEN